MGLWAFDRGICAQNKWNNTPTPIDQVSSQSDKFYYVFVHLESESVKTKILIAKVTVPECQNYCNCELVSKW